MNNLDGIEQIKKLDTGNVLGSIEQLGDQCQQAWDEASRIEFPDSYRKVTSVVFSGMGGSALGAYVVKSLFADVLPVPFEIINDYHLPPYTNEKTLVILASYSGSTEETLSCAADAFLKHTQVTGLTVGGKLAEILKSANVPAYIFAPKYNPSNQPRLGTGYSVFGLICLLNSLGLLSFPQLTISEVVSVLTKGKESFGVSAPTAKNKAKQLAISWKQKIPVIVSAEFLGQVGRVIRNQLHESAKTFAAYHMIPELNHHLLEVTNPKICKESLRFLFLTSVDYSPRIQKRLFITQDLFRKQGMAVEEFKTSAKDQTAQTLECIQFGAFANYYLAMLYDLDPSKIPWVDYFKDQLSK